MSLFSKFTDHLNKHVPKYSVNTAIRNRDYDEVLNKWARTSAMNYLQDKAYARPEGYAIGYVNGKKVMFVSGSRNNVDWLFNVADDFIDHDRHYVSNNTARNLTRIAKREGVDLVVGHSRGAALVAKMNIPNDRKLGLDGAMRLAPPGKRDMMNLYQKQTLDRVITARGTNRKGYRLKRPMQYHFITRDYPRYKTQYYRKGPGIGPHGFVRHRYVDTYRGRKYNYSY